MVFAPGTLWVDLWPSDYIVNSISEKQFYHCTLLTLQEIENTIGESVSFDDLVEVGYGKHEQCAGRGLLKPEFDNRWRLLQVTGNARK
jgi:hypothetical protein